MRGESMRKKRNPPQDEIAITTPFQKIEDDAVTVGKGLRSFPLLRRK